MDIIYDKLHTNNGRKSVRAFIMMVANNRRSALFIIEPLNPMFPTINDAFTPRHRFSAPIYCHQ